MKSEVLSAFRGHRHDVLNGMQVVRGYIQLGRTQEAISAIDRLTTWLRSLTLIQSLAATNYRWLTAASHCPHVILSECFCNETLPDETDCLLADVWSWLNEEMSLIGIRELITVVNVPPNPPSTNGDELAFWVDIQADSHVAAWWQGTARDERYKRYLRMIREE